MIEAYLDIETTGLSLTSDHITVVGIYLTDGSNERFLQLVGDKVTASNLLEALNGVDVIYTYNGTGFDLPFLNALLGINLVQDFRHHDLMLDCWRKNLYGGFKAVETQLGISRQLKNVKGWEAVRLWWRYRRNGDQDACDVLLKYNRDDVLNLRSLKQRLEIDQE